MNRSASAAAFAALIVVAGSLLAADAQAQNAGSVVARIGATRLVPSGGATDPTSSAVLGGAGRFELAPATQVSVGLRYVFARGLSLDLSLPAVFRHDLRGAGGSVSGGDRLGEVRLIPVSLLAQWRFLDPDALLQPYVGVGPTYARVTSTRGSAALDALTGGSAQNPTRVDVDSDWTWSAQAGISYAYEMRWFVDFAVTRTALKPQVRFSSGQSFDLKIDPVAYAFSIGYRY